MSTFAEIDLKDIRTDCRFYTGYKPCHKNDGCPGCTHFAPRGVQILIIKLGAMGDVLRTKAILPALKRRFPESWIVWITAPGSESLVRDPMVDEIHALGPEGLLALEGRPFHSVYCLDKDRHAMALSAKLDAGRRLGFAPTAYNTATVWNDASMYALRLGLSDELKFFQNQKTVPQIVAEMCELDYQGEPYGLQIGAAARFEAAQIWARLFAEHGGAQPAGAKVVGLNTGCGPVFATKAWPVERMADFVASEAARGDRVFVLLGGKREEAIHRRLMEAAGPLAGSRVIDAGTGNSLEVFFGLVERCDAVLSADSLGMHVAIALARPVVVWFGPTCHAEVDVFGRGEKIVTDFPCSPCYLKECPKPVFCLDAMSIDSVRGALDRALA